MKLILLTMVLTVSLVSCSKKVEEVKECGKVFKLSKDVQPASGGRSEVLGYHMWVKTKAGEEKYLYIKYDNWIKQPYSLGIEYCE